jgi:hypothetical protein
MTENTEKPDEEVSIESVKPDNPFGMIIVIYWICVIFWGIQSEMRCTGYGCYEGLILLPLGAFGMIMTIPYLLISMFKK